MFLLVISSLVAEMSESGKDNNEDAPRLDLELNDAEAEDEIVEDDEEEEEEVSFGRESPWK